MFATSRGVVRCISILLTVICAAFVVTPAGRNRCEGLSSVGEDSGCARCRFIASDDYIRVEWIKLDATAHPPSILGGHKG